MVGDEYSKRVAIRDAILLQEDEKQTVVLQRFARGISVEEISEIIRKAESDWKIKFSNTLIYQNTNHADFERWKIFLCL